MEMDSKWEIWRQEDKLGILQNFIQKTLKSCQKTGDSEMKKRGRSRNTEEQLYRVLSKESFKILRKKMSIVHFCRLCK